MIDSVLKGTGNSRFLKSAVPAGTSWADALAMLQAGTFPIDFNGINTEGFQQVGTPLNKANLLKDATAAQIGLPPSTTPDGMFRALGNTGELHVWRKTIANGTGTYSLGAVQEGLHYINWANYATSDSSVGTFEYGSEISVDNDGAITGIKNPSTITIKPWDDDVSKANVFKGKFIKMISQVETSMSSFKTGEIWWIPADAIMTTGLVNGEGNTRYIAASKRQQVIGVPAGTTTTYPVSTNPNAWQEGDDAKPAGYTLGDVVMGSFRAGATNYTISYSYEAASELTVSDDGRTVSMTSPSAGSFGFMGGLEPGGDPAKIRAFMLGKFVRCTAKGDQLNEAPDTKYPFNTIPSDIVYIPSSAQITMANGDVLVDRYQPVTGYAAIPAGTTIEYLGKLGDKTRIQVVSYVGTGTYGSSNPCSITADFKIKVAICLKSEDWYQSSSKWVEIADDLKTQYQQQYGFVYRQMYNAFGKRSSDSKTITWYNTYSSSAQLNASGVKYTFLIIG